jgi:AcrR family transcriptional regulator
MHRVTATYPSLMSPPAGYDSQLPLAGEDRLERADAARNRAAILCAAERLLSERPAGELTMDDVACAAGVGKGTVFRRFGDRAGLFHALLDDRERAFQEGFIRGPSPLGPGAPALERLVAFGRARLELIARQGDLLLAAEMGAPWARMRSPVYAAHRAHVAILVREVCAEDADADFLSDVLLGSLAADLVLYEHRVRGMSWEEIGDAWEGLACSLSSAGAPTLST